VLDFHTGAYRDIPHVADAYLLSLDEKLRNKVDWLLGLIDRALKADTISQAELSVIFSRFNEAFSQTNPQVEIVAWGSLVDVLRSDGMQEALVEAVEEELDEDEKPAAELKSLLDVNGFDQTDGDHLALARSFLATQLSM
jgi:pyruvate dehydrogenase complex dehydrogenase (E1) component